MSANLAHPWILARLALASASLALALLASIAAVRILLVPSGAPADERALRAERDAELASAGLGLAFALELLAAASTVLVAHRLAGSVRGAMCAYGVLQSAEGGALSLEASALAALAASAWLGVRAVDSRIARGSLSRTLARGALVVTALVALDAVLVGRFLLSIDLRAHASCCSTAVGAATRIDPGGRALTSVGVAWVASVAALACVALAAAVRARPTPSRAGFASVVAFGASALVLASARDVVAPFAFESPGHRCVYCLLRADEAGPFGPVLAVAWAIATAVSAWVLGAAWVGRRAAARAASESALRSIALLWAACWTIVFASAWAPIVAYRLHTGTFALFGR